MESEYLKRLEYRVTVLTEAAKFALATNRYLWNRLRWYECSQTVEVLEAALNEATTATHSPAKSEGTAARAGDA